MIDWGIVDAEEWSRFKINLSPKIMVSLVKIIEKAGGRSLNSIQKKNQEQLFGLLYFSKTGSIF